MMSRRTATLSTLLGLVAVLIVAVPVMAKTGTLAKLDATLHRNATPGSTIAVAWSLYQVVDDKESPFSTQGVYMRLVGVDGKSSTEVVGTETPFGSGHYKAAIQVPPSGIGEVLVGMKGEQCTATDGCSRSDIIFPLNDDRLVTGYAPAPKPAAPVASTQPVSTSAPVTAQASTTTSASVSSQLTPLVAIGIAVAVAAGAAALIVGRRRPVDAPTGR